MNASVWILIAAGAAMFLAIGGLSMMSHHYTLGNIKSRTVGDGQHGTARWATDKEIKQTYAHVPFKVREWRRGQNLPTEQGLILGCKGQPQELTALVDSDDIHCLMIGASGIGKTAFFLYPNLEYACASGMSWLALDSKGDLARNYGTIAKNCYMYLRDRSDAEGKCWPGIKTIASDMRLSRSTVKRALTDLEQHGYLQKIPRYRDNGSSTSNLYSVQ